MKSPSLLLASLSALALVATTSAAHARPKKKPAASRPKKDRDKAEPKPDLESAAPTTPTQEEADRHFRSGVTLYKEAKYSEALAEFERAYEIAPHPLVLYNIAGCQRELSRYAEAVRYYRRFLEEGRDTITKVRLDNAQGELNDILARIARVTVTVQDVEGAELVLDGEALGTLPLDMPLVLPPGEHKLVARAAGYRDAERVLRLASGDELQVDLTMVELPAAPKAVRQDRPRKRHAARRFSLGAGFGTNLRQVGETGAPSARLALAMGRVELGVEGVFVAYAVVPSLRVRLLGDALSLHLVAAAPVAIKAGAMEETFVAGAGGLGLRYRASPALAFRLETYASYAGKAHGTTVPTFFGGELWF